MRLLNNGRTYQTELMLSQRNSIFCSSKHTSVFDHFSSTLCSQQNRSSRTVGPTIRSMAKMPATVGINLVVQSVLHCIQVLSQYRFWTGLDSHRTLPNNNTKYSHFMWTAIKANDNTSHTPSLLLCVQKSFYLEQNIKDSHLMYSIQSAKKQSIYNYNYI